jgi:hypothetical protein
MGFESKYEQVASYEQDEERLRRELIGELQQALLPNLASSEKDDDETREDKEHELFGLTEESTLFEKYYVLGTQSGPIVLSLMMGLSGTFINLVFAGHYTHEGDSGDKSIVFAGVSLANVSVSCFGLSSFFFLLSSFFYQIIPSFFAFADVGECDVFIFINWYEQCC